MIGTTPTRFLQSSFPRPLEIPQTARDSHISSAMTATIYRFSTNRNLNPGSKSVKYVPGLKCQLCPRSHKPFGQRYGRMTFVPEERDFTLATLSMSC